MNATLVPILMADDDPDDRMLTMEAFQESHLANELYFVEDGEALLDYLYHRGMFNTENAPRPGLILLDLNMPKLDGRAALAKIKSDPNLKRIPIVILTTSKAEEDIVKSYDLGVNSFITKPVTFRGLVQTAREIGEYWFGLVSLPKE
jgi:two-component system, response regulator